MVGGTIFNIYHFETLKVTQARLEMITARMVITALGALKWQRELTPNRFQRCRIFIRRRQRDTGEKTVGVRVLWPGEKRVNGSFFYNFAGLHHGHAATGF